MSSENIRFFIFILFYSTQSPESILIYSVFRIYSILFCVLRKFSILSYKYISIFFIRFSSTQCHHILFYSIPFCAFRKYLHKLQKIIFLHARYVDEQITLTVLEICKLVHGIIRQFLKKKKNLELLSPQNELTTEFTMPYTRFYSEYDKLKH